MSERAEDSPARDRYVVARVDDIPEGTRLIVDVGGRSIGVFRVDGRFYAIGNRCPHKGGELCKGQILEAVVSERPGDVRLAPGKKLLVCPWHAWEFELETGQSWFDPRGPRMRTFGVAVERGADIDAGAAAPGDERATLVDAATHRVKGPYRADVFPIVVEDDYLVVSMRSGRRA